MNTIKIIYRRSNTDEELNQILELQQRNLSTNVSKKERDQEGFLTVSHSFELLRKMNVTCPHIIAKAKDKVIGYALCMHPRFSNEIEILKPMFQEIEALVPKLENYVVMGQVCIDKKYRKKGIFRNLYQTMQDAIKPEFSTIITEVDSKNTRSLQAHYAVGFKLLKHHISRGQNWKLIVLNSK